MKKIAFMLCTAFLVFSGCSKDSKPEISIDKVDLSFNFDGKALDESTFSIRSNWDWELVQVPDESSESGWVSFDKSSGNGDAVITVTVSKNSHTPRQTEFKVVAEDRFELITIKQNGSDLLEVLPDPVFREYCLLNFDANGDYTLSEEEFRAVKEIYLFSSAIVGIHTPDIKSLEGIELFTSLEKLTCPYPNLPALNVSQNKALKELRCEGNPINVLILSENKSLERLNCRENSLYELDLSQNTALKHLDCSNNKLASLDLSHNPGLTNVKCSQNKLTELDLQANEALEYLTCHVNGITELDLSKNSKITYLSCNNNELTDLDLSANPLLDRVECMRNKLTELNTTANTVLTYLNCEQNQLTSLQFPSSVKYFYCQKNQLTAVDVSQNTALAALMCSDNQITTLDISQNKGLDTFFCENNPDLAEVWVWPAFNIENPGEHFLYYKMDDQVELKIKE